MAPWLRPFRHQLHRADEHSGNVYAFSGKRVLVYTDGTTPEQYAGDFRALLVR